MSLVNIEAEILLKNLGLRIQESVKKKKEHDKDGDLRNARLAGQLEKQQQQKMKHHLSRMQGTVQSSQ